MSRTFIKNIPVSSPARACLLWPALGQLGTSGALWRLMIFVNILCYQIGNHHWFQKGLTEEGRLTLSVGGTISGVGFHRGWKEESILSTSVSLSLPPDHRWMQCDRPPHTPSCHNTFPEVGGCAPKLCSSMLLRREKQLLQSLKVAASTHFPFGPFYVLTNL